MTRQLRFSLPALLALLAGTPPAHADEIKIQGIAGSDKVVVMGDGRVSSKCINDLVLRTTGTLDLHTRNVQAARNCNSEMVVFATRNAMYLESPVTAWTDATTDHYSATLHPIVDVPVNLWIVDTASGAAAKAESDLDRANVLYASNKVGVHFAKSTKAVPAAGAGVILAGLVPNAAGTDFQCASLAAIQASAYYVANQLNIYYVAISATSTGQPFTGRNCAIQATPQDCNNPQADPGGDGNITFVSTAANRATLAHEIGHAFGLRPGPCGGHTNDVPGFTSRNIMWAGGDGNRDRFSLGQVFRMNMQRDVWGGTMLIKNNLVPAARARECPMLLTSPQCPALKTDWKRP